jgi:hypothetical protein
MNDQNKNDKSTVTGLPKITFSSFVLSLSSSALFHFGEIPDPVTNKKQKNIELAKQTIDILELLEKKTVNNLEKDEAVLLENLLYDLRMRYVNETKNMDQVKED